MLRRRKEYGLSSLGRGLADRPCLQLGPAAMKSTDAVSKRQRKMLIDKAHDVKPT